MEKAPIRKSVRVTAALLFSSLLLVIVLLIGELLTRSNPKYGRSGFVFSKDLIYHLNPNLVAQKAFAWGKTGQPPFTLTFNDQGFRGADFASIKKANTKRILMLGDSYTAGLDYPDSLIFSTQFVELLNKKGNTQYEIYNASCPAWGTDQEYLFWEKQGKKLAPDHVIIMMSPNDIRETWNHNVVRTVDGKVTINPPHLPFKERMGWNLASKSSFYQLMQKKVFNTDYGNFLRVFWSFPVNYGIQDSTDWDRPLFLKEPFQEVNDSYQLMEDLYAEIKRDCEGIGAEFHIVKLPILLEVDSTYQDSSLYDSQIVVRRMEELTTRNNISFYNFNELLLANPDPKGVFMDWEHHYDEDGHNWIAKMLYENIKL